MKKMLKRLCTGFLALATVVTALPSTPVHAESKVSPCATFKNAHASSRSTILKILLSEAILDGKCRACRYH